MGEGLCFGVLFVCFCFFCNVLNKVVDLVKNKMSWYINFTSLCSKIKVIVIAMVTLTVSLHG